VIIARPRTKKKNVFGTPISGRFGATEAASDFGSVCLAEAKSEVHTEARPYRIIPDPGGKRF
jgi:hypothetical protein